jgi:hypothetical protein
VEQQFGDVIMAETMRVATYPSGGVGIGLSTIDPAAGDTPQGVSMGVGAGIWWVISNLIGLVVGG